MKGHRRTLLTSAVTALLSALAAPAAYASSPILSGYGGPGAGEQVILGSHLLNTPSGGGSGGPSGGVVSAQTPTESSSEPQSSGTPSTSPESASGPQAGSTTVKGPRSSRQAPRRRSAPERVVALSPASDTKVGVPGGVLLVVLLVAAALLAVGLVTMRLSRLEQ